MYVEAVKICLTEDSMIRTTGVSSPGWLLHIKDKNTPVIQIDTIKYHSLMRL